MIALLPFAASLSGEEMRTWKNADGNKSFQGAYVSHDGKRVTIRRTDGKDFTLSRDELHPDDRAWLAAKEDGIDLSSGRDSPAFDSLRFGDDRETVEKKLRASRMVEAVGSDIFASRTGLNGSFRTREKIGGLSCELYFDWDDAGRLKEITLQTEPVPASDYGSRLKENWSELAFLLRNLHGKPVQVSGYPDSSALKNGMFLGSHLWRLEGGGSALLGTSMQKGACMAVVRFTAERIDPAGTP